MTAEVISDGVQEHKSSECRWQPSRIYPGHEACLVNGAAHYRETEAAQGAAPRQWGREAAEWHRYLHAEGMLVEDEGEDCGPWHHRVFIGRAAPRAEGHTPTIEDCPD